MGEKRDIHASAHERLRLRRYRSSEKATKGWFLCFNEYVRGGRRCAKLPLLPFLTVVVSANRHHEIGVEREASRHVNRHVPCRDRGSGSLECSSPFAALT